MTKGHDHIIRHRLRGFLLTLFVCVGFIYSYAINPEEIYDIDRAKAYCDSMPLQSPEGIWIYPEDGVTVLITRKKNLSQSQLPSYNIRIIESTDARLCPGEIIGMLYATPEIKKFEVQLYTERKNNVLFKPKTILAQLSNDEETMILKKDKAKLNFRLFFNPSLLLPNMWRIVRLNTSTNNSSSTPTIGMVKIYPSYDGNGSSHRQPRYL